MQTLGAGEAAIGVGITVVAGSARIAGNVARPEDYATYFDQTLIDGSTAAAQDPTTGANEAATVFAEIFSEQMFLSSQLARETERRNELKKLLEQASVDDPVTADLRREYERLSRKPKVLLLRDAAVWAPGCPYALEVEFVRVPIEAVTAWWLGFATAADGTRV